MRWKLRPEYFSGSPGPSTISFKPSDGKPPVVLELDVDAKGCFTLSKPVPLTIPLGVFAERVRDAV